MIQGVDRGRGMLCGLVGRGGRSTAGSGPELGPDRSYISLPCPTICLTWAQLWFSAYLQLTATPILEPYYLYLEDHKIMQLANSNPSAITISFHQQDISILKYQLKSLAKTCLKLAPFRLKYQQSQTTLDSLKEENKTLKQTVAKLTKKQGVLDKEIQGLKEKTDEIKVTVAGLKKQNTGLMLEMGSLRTKIQKAYELLQAPTYHTLPQQLKQLSKACLKLSQDNLCSLASEEQISQLKQTLADTTDKMKSASTKLEETTLKWETEREQFKKRRTAQKKLKQKLAAMQKSFRLLEQKYQRQSQDLNQMANSYISLQESNFELLKDMEEKEMGPGQQ